MPVLGETKTVQHKTGYNKYVYHACSSCDERRWVQLLRGEPRRKRCSSCNNKQQKNINAAFRAVDSLPRDKQRNRLILRTCSSCNRKDWVRRANGKNEPESTRCRSCANRVSTTECWAGVIKEETLKNGRVFVKLGRSSPYYSIADTYGWIRRSRLVMSEHLGRCLDANEIVHHVRDVLDDEFQNLRLMTNSSHSSYHARKKLQEYRESQYV